MKILALLVPFTFLRCYIDAGIFDTFCRMY